MNGTTGNLMNDYKKGESRSKEVSKMQIDIEEIESCGTDPFGWASCNDGVAEGPVPKGAGAFPCPDVWHVDIFWPPLQTGGNL